MVQRKEIDGNAGPMKLIFSYEDVFYSFFYDDISGCIHRSSIASFTMTLAVASIARGSMR